MSTICWFLFGIAVGVILGAAAIYIEANRRWP